FIATTMNLVTFFGRQVVVVSFHVQHLIRFGMLHFILERAIYFPPIIIAFGRAAAKRIRPQPTGRREKLLNRNAFARFRGISTSLPSRTAISSAKS
ncbi:MAG: hypothetical protein LBU45_05190, partial [Azoarcus sp.]|nr:hypothetical protein [Azoarcus sp.]